MALYRANSYPFCPRRITWIEAKMEGVKSGRSGAFEPDQLGLNRKTNNCRDSGAEALGVMPIHETRSMEIFKKY